VAYIGNEPVIGQWRKLDDISGSFNGSLTSFTTQVGGTNVTAGSANQLLVSLGGVLQEPGTDYSVSSSTITFTTAPAASLSFFAVLAGDALNTSVPADGSITTAKLGSNLTVDLDLGSAGTPSLTFDADTGLFSGGDNQVNVSTSGVERVEFGASEVVFNDGGADYDFRVEGDTNANLLFVDASTDRVGVGTSSPDTILTVSTPNVAVTSQSSNVNIYANDALAADIGGSIGLGATWNGTGGLINYASIHGKKANATSGNTDGYMSFVVRDNGGTSERARIDSSGRLLVGTSADIVGNANALLQLVNSASPNLVIGTTNTATTDGTFLGLQRFFSNAGSTQGEAVRITAQLDGTASSSAKPGRLVFHTTSSGGTLTERVRITSDGFVRLQTSGAGIQFNGDTAAENSLDDYEEGTFANPEIVPSSGSFSSVTYDGDTAAKYIKIGQIVHYWGTVRWTAFSVGTGSGTLRVTAPFQVASRENGDDADNVGATIVPVWTGTGTAVPTTIQAQNGLARCILRATRHDAVSVTLLVSDVGSTGMVAFSLTYKTP